MNTFQHHTGNVSAILAPALSWSLSLPDTFTLAVGVLGILWYCVLFYDRFFRKKKNDDQTS